jgi:head-tail adaptor
VPSLSNLRHELELIFVGLVLNASGGFDRNDTVDASVDADIRPASWSQQQRAMRSEIRISHVATIRWDPDLAIMVTPQSRARFVDDAGRVRNLSVKTVVDPDERGRWLELGCEEGGPL